MDKNNYLKFLIILVAVVVIIESVVLVQSIDESRKKAAAKRSEITGQTVTLAPSVTTANKNVLDVRLSTKTPVLKMGQSGQVSVDFSSFDKKYLDTINLYVKYDPAKVTISGLQYNPKLPKPVFSKISDKTGLVVSNIFISDAKGYAVEPNVATNISVFSIKPKVPGLIEFEISTGKDSKESATMFVETQTSKALPYSSNKLTVNVQK